MLGLELTVGVVIQQPTIVTKTGDVNGYLLFMNEIVRSPGGNAPLIVCVDPAQQFVVTSYFDRRGAVGMKVYP
jgi:hypothetical protein